MTMTNDDDHENDIDNENDDDNDDVDGDDKQWSSKPWIFQHNRNGCTAEFSKIESTVKLYVLES